ncbi:MAG: hypothetical protein ABI618_18305, partial [Nitrospirota bacterium]
EFEGTVKQILVRMTIFGSGNQYFASFLARTFSQSPIILRVGHPFKKTKTPLPPTSLLTKKCGVSSSNHVALYAMDIKRSFDQHSLGYSYSPNQVSPIALTLPLARLVNESDTVIKA